MNKRRIYCKFSNAEYLYRIRSTKQFNIDAFNKDIISGSISKTLNDRTELYFSLDKRKFKHFLRKLSVKIKQRFFNTSNSNKIYKYIKKKLIPANESDLRYCILISCFSKNDLRRRKDMWIKYTAQGQSEEGFLLVYKKSDLINAANNQLKIKYKKYGDVSYCSKKKNDKTNFYIDLFNIILNDKISTSFSNPLIQQYLCSNQTIYALAINSLMIKKGYNDTVVDDLIYSKEKCWSTENEWRLIGDNTKFNNQNPQMSALYGDVLKCSPFSIYIRRKVDIKTKNLLINIGKGKNIDVYVEKNDKCFEYYKV